MLRQFGSVAVGEVKHISVIVCQQTCVHVAIQHYEKDECEDKCERNRNCPILFHVATPKVKKCAAEAAH